MSTPDRTPSAVEIYDTTLRDGTQLEGISVTVDDKLRTSLIDVGAADVSAEVGELAGWLERQIKATESDEAYHALQAWSDEVSGKAARKSSTRKKTARSSRSTGTRKKTPRKTSTKSGRTTSKKRSSSSRKGTGSSSKS